MRTTKLVTALIFAFYCTRASAGSDVHFTAALSYTFPELCPVYSTAGELIRPCSDPSTRTVYAGHAAFQLVDHDLLFSISAPSGDWDFTIIKASGESIQVATCAYYGYERVPVPPPIYVPGEEIIIGDLEPIDPGEQPPLTTPTDTNYFEIIRFIQPCNPASVLHLSENDIIGLLAGTWQIEARQPTPPDPINSPLVPVFGSFIVPLDSDADGVPDFRDACASTPPGALIRAEGCSIEQLSPCTGPWKNHGEYVKHMRAVVGSFLEEGLITPAVAQTMLRGAANSNCGRPSR